MVTVVVLVRKLSYKRKFLERKLRDVRNIIKVILTETMKFCFI